MRPAPGDSFSVRIGGDASGPVVAGHDNHVEVHRPADGSTPSGDPADGGPTQTNTADGNSTMYTVMNGELHVHHENESGEPPER
ncbi:hypothetical protein ABZY93_01445 [Streptomyces smyrnaeus]|uniref:hypothetical protein n=1 Tax=Streptomyces smyrnaeus TaxID=1387713 RepID=UPI0033B3311F